MQVRLQNRRIHQKVNLEKGSFLIKLTDEKFKKGILESLERTKDGNPSLRGSKKFKA